MREIKFRFWNTEKRKFEEFLYLSGSGEIINFDCNYAEVTPNIIASQYTGLKDNNRKEIYEGDIVKEDLNDTTGSIVKWDESNLEYKLYEVLSEAKNGYLCLGMKLIVVGNIFENPELVEK